MQNSLACFPNRSDECDRRGTYRQRKPDEMKNFTIDTENNITFHESRKAAKESGAGVFTTEEQFADLIGADNKRLIEIWNSLPGVKPVTKFMNRKVATERIWKGIQSLGEPVLAETAAQTQESQQPQETATEMVAEPAAPTTPKAAQTPDVAPGKGKSGKKATKTKQPPTPKDSAGPSKKDVILGLLAQEKGTTLAALMEATGWQAHSVRGFISGSLNKKGIAVNSEKRDGIRIYSTKQ